MRPMCSASTRKEIPQICHYSSSICKIQFPIYQYTAFVKINNDWDLCVEFVLLDMHKQIAAIKAIALVLLSVPFLLLVCYEYPPSFRLNSMTNSYTKFPKFATITSPLLDQIDKQIQELKLRVSTTTEERSCPRFVKYSQMETDIKLEGSEEFCAGRGLVYGSQLVYVHVVVEHGNYPQIYSNLQLLANRLRDGLSNKVHIIPHLLDPSTLPQHIKQKTSDELYIKDLAKQLLEMAQFRSCKFTTVSQCQNLIIILNNWTTLKQKQSYYSVGPEIIFAHHEHSEQVIGEVLGMQQLANARNWNKVRRMQVLQRVKADLQKMAKIMEEGYMIVPSLAYLEQYAQRVHSYMQSNINEQSVAPESLLDQKQAFVVDLMASEYKVGVFLPPLLILVLFPCFNICKA